MSERVCLYLMLNGTMLIAEEVHDPELGMAEIKNVFMIEISAKGAAMIPAEGMFMGFAEEKSFRFEKDKILARGNPTAKVMETYRQAKSGILLAKTLPPGA